MVGITPQEGFVFETKPLENTRRVRLIVLLSAVLFGSILAVPLNVLGLFGETSRFTQSVSLIVFLLALGIIMRLAVNIERASLDFQNQKKEQFSNWLQDRYGLNFDQREVSLLFSNHSVMRVSGSYHAYYSMRTDETTGRSFLFEEGEIPTAPTGPITLPTGTTTTPSVSTKTLSPGQGSFGQSSSSESVSRPILLLATAPVFIFEGKNELTEFHASEEASALFLEVMGELESTARLRQYAHEPLAQVRQKAQSRSELIEESKTHKHVVNAKTALLKFESVAIEKLRKFNWKVFKPSRAHFRGLALLVISILTLILFSIQ